MGWFVAVALAVVHAWLRAFGVGLRTEDGVTGWLEQGAWLRFGPSQIKAIKATLLEGTPGCVGLGRGCVPRVGSLGGLHTVPRVECRSDVTAIAQLHVRDLGTVGNVTGDGPHGSVLPG